MRNNFIKAASAVLLLASVMAFHCSCSEDETTRVEYQGTFYLGVNLKDATCIYKSGELLCVLEPNSQIRGIAVMPDGCIYACGDILNIPENGGNALTSAPAIWKDGKRLDLDLGASGSMTGMVASGNSWICCGTLKGDDGEYGVIIEDGKVVYRSESNISFKCMDRGASGDCYVVTDGNGKLSLQRISADNWELKTVDVIAADGSEGEWIPNCIHVGNADIAVGLTKFNRTTFESDAYFWLDDGRGIERIGNSSVASDITFYNGWIVVGGYKATVKKTPQYLTVDTKAVQWINGEGQDFSYDCIGNSEVALLKSWNNMFLFQCVTHEGGIQICNNGSLIEEISFDEKPSVTCWDVRVRAI